MKITDKSTSLEATRQAVYDKYIELSQALVHQAREEGAAGNVYEVYRLMRENAQLMTRIHRIQSANRGHGFRSE